MEAPRPRGQGIDENLKVSGCIEDLLIEPTASCISAAQDCLQYREKSESARESGGHGTKLAEQLVQLAAREMLARRLQPHS